MEGYHRSVLLREVVEALSIKKSSWYLDCTLGDGGHALEILKLGGKVVGIDVDPQAIDRAQGRLGKSGGFKTIRGNFRDLKNLLKQMDADRLKFAGAIFDLGVSGLQLETPERGFSFSKMGPLDMRMDPALGVRALDLINILSRKEVYELFNTLGEEKYSRRLADAVDSARQVKKIETTTELSEIAVRAVGAVKGKIHPATRIFQALRIAINDELNALQEGLDQVKDIVFGPICVISFHSLEDRIVKNAFLKWQSWQLGQVKNKKVIMATDEEVENNPRARSAKLRIFERYDYH